MSEEGAGEEEEEGGGRAEGEAAGRLGVEEEESARPPSVERGVREESVKNKAWGSERERHRKRERERYCKKGSE
eukprot:3886150-Rhodomonas_salina.1